MARELFQDTIRATGLGLMGLVTAVVFARFFALTTHFHLRMFTFEDGWVFCCHSCFMTLAVLYLYIVPAYFRVVAVGAGEPYPEYVNDNIFMQKALFAATTCLWFSLWSCKFGLLSIYKKMVSGLEMYTRLWWTLVVFCALASSQFSLLPNMTRHATND